MHYVYAIIYVYKLYRQVFFGFSFELKGYTLATVYDYTYIVPSTLNRLLSWTTTSPTLPDLI